MAGQWTDLFSYVTGVVRKKNLGYLVLSDDEVSKKRISNSGFVQWRDGKWGDGGDTNWLTAAVAITNHPLEQLIALGENGTVLLLGSGDRHEEQIGSGKFSPKSRGPMRGIRNIGGNIYVVGMNRQVYRREGLNNWVSIDNGARPSAKSEEVVGFESIDGFSETEIYAVGWEGEIWKYDGKAWTQLDSPTNYVLVNVCCGGNGHTYACGRNGMLVRGRGDKWDIVGQENVTDDIWGLAWFNSKLYISTMDSIYTLEEDELEIVDMGKDQAKTCYHLSAADGVLWSIGAKDVMSYNGKKWTRID